MNEMYVAESCKTSQTVWRSHEGWSGDNITTHTEIAQSTHNWGGPGNETSMTTEIAQSTHNWGGPGNETIVCEIAQKKLTVPTTC